uniref:Leukotriene C4 synthase n=1 Tax=Vombatus ursinus TaxID=29139 RepID=A0A4X2LYG1_VOMUR
MPPRLWAQNLSFYALKACASIIPASPLQGVAAACGLLYLGARYRYFHGYAVSAQGRLGPLYFGARVLWLLVALSALGLASHFLPASLKTPLLRKLHWLVVMG